MIKKLPIEGLLVIQPTIFSDDRGYFFESFNQTKFEELVGKSLTFLQDNESFSKKGVLRGLHFQREPYAQGKLVRVSRGAVLDVAVDLRRHSPTYGKYEKVLLSAENKTQFWIPEGFAHGFLALEEETVFNYKCTNFYDKASEGGLNWNDPKLAIDWELSSPPLLSEKDKMDVQFENFSSPFE